MPNTFTSAELEAYLDEALPSEQAASIEMALRAQPDLLRQLSEINARRDAGVHSLGEIWRRERLTCPTRQQWGSYLLSILPDEQLDYLTFHLQQVGCRYCQANLADLQTQQADVAETVSRRRTRYFQSSAGYLHAK